MKELNDSDEMLTQPGTIPRPISPEDVEGILYPTGVALANEDTDHDDDDILLPLMDE